MEQRLDRIDIALLRALQNNARISNKELAAAVDLAPSSCLERVRRLEAAGVLRGARMEVAPRALGIRLEALVAVQLVRHSSEAVASFQEHLRRQREVLSIYHLAGAEDFQIHVALRDTDHLREVTQRIFTQRPEVARIQTSVIFEHHAGVVMPCYEAEEEAPRRRRAPRRG